MSSGLDPETIFHTSLICHNLSVWELFKYSAFGVLCHKCNDAGSDYSLEPINDQNNIINRLTVNVSVQNE